MAHPRNDQVEGACIPNEGKLGRDGANFWYHFRTKGNRVGGIRDKAEGNFHRSQDRENGYLLSSHRGAPIVATSSDQTGDRNVYIQPLNL